jgi:hypothetical protein
MGVNDIVLAWEKIRAGDLAGTYIGLLLLFLFALAILIIALLWLAFGRKRKASP